jgi:hypothetical protein
MAIQPKEKTAADNRVVWKLQFLNNNRLKPVE